MASITMMLYALDAHDADDDVIEIWKLNSS